MPTAMGTMRPNLPKPLTTREFGKPYGVPQLGPTGIVLMYQLGTGSRDPGKTLMVPPEGGRLQFLYPGSFRSITSDVSASNSETLILDEPVPANSYVAGKTVDIYASALFTMAANLSSTSIVRVRIGPVSMLGTIVASVLVNNGKGKVQSPFTVEGAFTVRTVGALAAVSSSLAMWGAAAAPFIDDINVPAVDAVFNSTIDNRLQMTYQTSNSLASALFRVAKFG